MNHQANLDIFFFELGKELHVIEIKNSIIIKQINDLILKQARILDFIEKLDETKNLKKRKQSLKSDIDSLLKIKKYAKLLIQDLYDLTIKYDSQIKYVKLNDNVNTNLCRLIK